MTHGSSRSETSNQWLDLDEVTEAIWSLQLVADLILGVEQQPYLWKWVVISLHNSLQTYLILAIWGGDHRRIMSERHLEIYKRRNAGSDREAWRGKYYVAPFGELYAKVKLAKPMADERDEQRAEWLDPGASTGPFRATESIDRSVKKLDDLRHEFLHYRPQSVSYSVPHMIDMVRDCLSLVRFLAVDNGALQYLNSEIRETAGESLQVIRDHLDRLQEYGPDEK